MTHMDQREVEVTVAEAKRRLSELLGRVAFGGTRVLILRRGRPMARLVPLHSPENPSLADVRGWLDDDDPFFGIVDRIVAARSRHAPKVVPKPRRTRRR